MLDPLSLSQSWNAAWCIPIHRQAADRVGFTPFASRPLPALVGLCDAGILVRGSGVQTVASRWRNRPVSSLANDKDGVAQLYEQTPLWRFSTYTLFSKGDGVCLGMSGGGKPGWETAHERGRELN